MRPDQTGETMRIATIAFAALAFATPGTVSAQQPDKAELAKQGAEVIKAFAGHMLNELQGAMKAGGPVNAVNVCNGSAPAIAKEEMAKSGGWKIGRTALRVRNPNNAPDAFEKAALDEFAAKAAGGADVATLAKADIVEEGGKRVFRLVKAIPLGEPCLGCHGSELKPEVQEVIGKLYPQDKATGFKTGDLRGAFTLSKPLP